MAFGGRKLFSKLRVAEFRELILPLWRDRSFEEPFFSDG